MLKKLGTLKMGKYSDYLDTVVKILEEAGYVLVLTYDGVSERRYIVYKAEGEDEE